MSVKKCFFNADRPCDLTCKAAFEVDDPVDNVDCQFIALAYHLQEGLIELKNVFENFGGFPLGGGNPPDPGGGPGGPKKKGFPNN